MPRLTTSDCLPHDIWTAISNLVASESIHGLCSLRMVCRATRDTGRENVVLVSVSIPSPIGMATIWGHYPAAVAFFNRCRESGNPELLFREGLSECFLRCLPDSGLDMLRSAALKGHYAAKYAASLVIFLRPAEAKEMEEALEWFRSVDASSLLRECMRLCSVVFSSTSRHAVQMPQIGDTLVCDSPCCPTRGKTRVIYNYHRRGSQYQHWRCYDASRTVPCVKCRADYELILFVNGL